MLLLGKFSHTYQMFDEILKNVFMRVFGQLIYVERWGQFANVCGKGKLHGFENKGTLNLSQVWSYCFCGLIRLIA